ncbi:MAG: HlyD family type I secretion periplasmic adaptor subunit [Alphaproteobacteria bacterium]|nr:HlyD family type I secretion periplasmic adaptor subunit [Alphaproteobacteria bacterium]MBT4545051.1 HlyD family type I secretion periplasmic adaptor subunit [Alphaproteobacteria bacterium]MBT6386155.1 HlyD family type I secretion periplasmic adaptor subunit [Alphaproteobacteria bacterium]MBT7745834.1 HlyD family type I secretion periplasmic adaptor subunit [Alphaproteobacteria bacterium]
MSRLRQDSDFAAPVLSQLVNQLRDTSNRLAHEQVLTLQRAADSADVLELEPEGMFGRLKSFFSADADLIAFQPDAVEIERQAAPLVAKVLLYSIFFFITGLFIWANYSTIDTAVMAQGRITTEVPNIIIQPSETAIIKSILVREGQFVEAGAVLATLDATLAKADVNVSRASLARISATEKRLEAESRGDRKPSKFSNDTAINALQVELFRRRQSSLKEQLSSFDQQISQLKGDIDSTLLDAGDLEEQAKVLREIEKMRTKLLKSGHGSRVNYLSSKHQRLAVNREQRQLVSARTRLTHQLEALRADRQAMVASWQSQISTELVRVRGEREGLAEQLLKTEHRESLVRLVAPAPGVVLSVANRSVGSVVQQAEQMFVIVPADVPMEMEVDILPKDIGLIQVGDTVRVKLEALPFQKHGIIEGVVRLISEDAVATEGRAAETVYRSRIELKERKLREVPESFRLTPGLTGSADITVGKRKIITYFVYPLVRAFDSSFKEP